MDSDDDICTPPDILELATKFARHSVDTMSRIVFFFLLIAIAHPSKQSKDTDASKHEPITVTPNGQFLGSWMESRRGRAFHAYRGIRYADAPVGELRFQPPKPILKYQEPINAREEGPACPQPVFTPGYNVDEDCLRVNVYTPANRSGLLPVVVFLHPGGFYSVSGRSDVAGPHYLLDRDIVYVSLNYRLGSLGFLSTGDEVAPGNNGFKDQVAGLRWIQRNIVAFGGDPALVTLTGYSAGSFSIGLHMVSPMSKGLFHRAITMSASPISQVVIGSHQRHLAERQARVLGCPTNSSRAIVDCLKTKTAKELGDSLDSMFEFGYDPVLLWNVVLEGEHGQERFLSEPPLGALRGGRASAVPVLVGQTRDEFFWKAFSVLNNETLFSQMKADWEKVAPTAFMLPPTEDAGRKANTLREKYFKDGLFGNDTQTADALGKLYSDAVIGFAVHRMAQLLSRHSSKPVYYYEFAYVGQHSHYEDPITKKPQGAAHHDDMLYLFTLTARFPEIGLEGPDAKLVDRMTALWYNFARYGNPNPRNDTPELGSLCWPPLGPSQTHLVINNDLTLDSNLFKDRFAVWDKLYPIDY